MLQHTTNSCPVHPDALVRFDLGDGGTGEDYVRRAGALSWGPGLGPDGEGRIRAYEVLMPADAPAEV